MKRVKDMTLTAIPRGDETSQEYDPDRHSEIRGQSGYDHDHDLLGGRHWRYLDRRVPRGHFERRRHWCYQDHRVPHCHFEGRFDESGGGSARRESGGESARWKSRCTAALDNLLSSRPHQATRENLRSVSVEAHL
jgi:hypothetical protein